ncbi:TRI59 protein, partial [Menura novaehollandiae]|nr:TRI59 protein [Menura novaehollandiae]
MDRLEEELTCAICYGIFEDPRVLPCSHTFCRECLDGLLQPSRDFSMRRCLSCPNCRAVVEIPAGGTKSLPINFALKAVIEKCQQEEPDVPSCGEHPRQPLNIYCLRDRELVCGRCLTIGRHHGHPIDDLQSAYRKAREASGKLQEELTDKSRSEVFSCYERLEKEKSQCESALQSQREAVVQYFKELADTLEHKKQALLSELDELNSHILEEYEPLLEDVEKMRLEEIELKELNAAVQKEESPLLFLEKLDGLQQRVQALKQKQLPAVKPVEIYPSMENLLKDVWSKTEIGQIDKIRTPKLKLIPKSNCPGKEKRQFNLRAFITKDPYLFVGLMATAVGMLQKGLSSGAIQAALTDISEFLLRVYQDSCIHVQNTVEELCHSSASLMGFCRRILPD